MALDVSLGRPAFIFAMLALAMCLFQIYRRSSPYYRQDLASGGELVYGQSVTDSCVGWDTTEGMLETLAGGVRRRRESAS